RQLVVASASATTRPARDRFHVFMSKWLPRCPCEGTFSKAHASAARPSRREKRVRDTRRDAGAEDPWVSADQRTRRPARAPPRDGGGHIGCSHPGRTNQSEDDACSGTAPSRPSCFSRPLCWSGPSGCSASSLIGRCKR